MTKGRDMEVRWGHRLGQWVLCKLTGGGRETLVDFDGDIPDSVFERRRNAPTWGLTPRMPECNVTAWPRLTPPVNRRAL